MEHTATIEPMAQSIQEGTLAVTPLVFRKLQLKRGQGVFLSADHVSFAVAKVGVLNVEELESHSTKGSSQLETAFKMPCWVELQNPQRGTSLDILLERDPYPREIAMVRMARTLRQMLLLERGDEVIIKPITTPKTHHSPIALLKHHLKKPFHWLLLLLIS